MLVGSIVVLWVETGVPWGIPLVQPTHLTCWRLVLNLGCSSER